jgi:hypothetical protein
MRPRYSAFSLSGLLFGLAFALATPSARAADNRFFEATPGYVRVKDLPDSLAGQVSSIEFRIYDAFEGSESHSGFERTLYDIGNKLHIDTREATLRRRVPFRNGDTVTVDALRETEKRLREEEFLADAIIEMKRLPDSTIAVKVTTYDQWSTTLGVSLARKGGEWVGWFGPVESNVLGTGQRLGFFVSHDLERDSRWLDYSNTAFTPWRLSLLGQYAWLSDGNSYAFSVSRPLRTRGQRWGFTLSATGYEFAETRYLSGNDLERLYDEGRLDTAYNGMLGRTNALWQWGRVQDRSFFAGVTRSYGRSLKMSVTPFYQGNVRDTVPGSGIAIVPADLYDSLGYAPPRLDSRHDQVLGATFSLYRYAYKTVHNFRNLKWSENIETGWRMSLSAGRNQEWLGAGDADAWYAYTGVYNDAWHDALFLNSSVTAKHFVTSEGEAQNGTASGYAEAQWKPLPALATVAVGQYDRLFAQTGDRKLYLGEESGLLGYPNFYYSGDSRMLVSLEQRFFPPVEFGTIVPALAAFAIAGDAWDGGAALPPGGPHYAAGIGLRLGATRSVQKVVNHFNLTWPIGEKHASGPVFGVRAAKNL